ncbi:MAG: hypothetical protein DMG32_02090, partial [Acidobacteria bacterium]
MPVRAHFTHQVRGTPGGKVLKSRGPFLQKTDTLERDEIESVLAALPSKGSLTLRDRALLLFLYNTGARVQEVADLCMANIKFDPHPCVHLHGKGNKWPICPLWPEMASLLRRLFDEQPTTAPPDHPVFTSSRGRALTRFGIYKIVRRHTRHLIKSGS